ncbi:MAG: rhodanese-like domain-containing protein [Candidatus Aquicultor sp.]|nr:rhodanese-like domain-containing protein [Candidatus Aquicultor sp.]
MRTKFALATLLILFVSLSILAGCGGNKQTSNKAVEQKSDSATITTKELSSKLGGDNLVVVDIRTKEEFNGWPTQGEARGGHIQGAVDFPIHWTKNISDGDIIKSLEAKGITADKTVVVYDAKGKQTAEMAGVLKGLGYSKILAYNDFMSWTEADSLPMDRLGRYEKLIHPAWLKDLVDGKMPATYDGRPYVILEVSWGEPKDYNQGHIPGAIHLNTDDLEGLPKWNFWPDNKLEALYNKLGITKDTMVIVYGNETIAAARALIQFMRAGVEDVRFLDGGYKSWTDAGYAVETKANNPIAVSGFGAKIPVHPEYVIGIDQAKDVLKDPNGRLVSIRSWDEFIGKISGYDYIPRAGEPKGAVWGHAGSDSSNVNDFHDQDGRMRNYDEITEMWAEWDITPEKNVAFYCGTGWRAAETWFYAYLMDWPEISLYDGGWFEWQMDKNNPIQTGDPRKK